MEIILSGRHMELTDELRQYAEAKFAQLVTEYDKLINARIVFEMERTWHLAEAHVTGKHIDLEASARSRDMYASIDEAYDKIHRQLRKHVEKMQTYRESQKMAEAMKDEMPALSIDEPELSS